MTPNDADGRQPPPPPHGEEFRATKKVRLREEDTAPLTDYRERLLAGSERPTTMDDLRRGQEVRFEQGDVVVDKSQPIPAVRLSPELKERLACNMKFSVVINLLGKAVGYTLLCYKLRQMWDLRGAKVVDMGGGFYLVQFASDEPYQEAILEGPWIMLGSYLQVQKWTTAFRIHHPTPLTMAVWIRVSELPLHLYPLTVITAIDEAVGKVIKVDYNTTGMQRGKFARLAVDVDLTKPLVSKISIDGEEFKVEYENLQELCFFCGMYGHLCDACVNKPKENDEGRHGEVASQLEVSNTEIYGPWMVVEKRRGQQGKSR